MSLLTDKQKAELHLAIHGYLTPLLDPSLLPSLSLSLSLPSPSPSSPSPSPSSPDPDSLPRKWMSVVRLQKKVLDLEAKVAAMEAEAVAGGAQGGVAGGVGGRRRGNGHVFLPEKASVRYLQGHRGPVQRVASHPNLPIFASCGDDPVIRVWDAEGGSTEKVLRGHTAAVQDVAFSQQGALASGSADLSVKLWDLERGECSRTLNGHDHCVSSVCFTPTGDEVVSASRDTTIKVWAVATGYCLRTLSGHSEWVRRVAVDASGTLLASASSDHTVRVWALSGSCLATIREHDHVVEDVVFTPAAAAGGAAAALNDLAPAMGLLQMHQQQLQQHPKDAKTSPPSPFLVSAGRDKLIKIFTVPLGMCVATLTGHDNWVRGVRFHPSGKSVLSCADDKSIRVWDLKTGRATRTVDAAHKHFVSSLTLCPADSPGGSLITSSVDATCAIWQSS